MITIILAIGLGLGLGVSLDLTNVASTGWSITWGILLMVTIQALIGLYIRKQVNGINMVMQADMAATQTKLMRKVEAFQRRPNGNVKQMQQELQEEQFSAIRRSLNKLNDLNKYIWWNLLLDRQINTMRMVMYYQLKEFGKVDELLPKCMMVSAQAVAMKLARMYKHNDPKLDKFFTAKTKRSKGDDVVLLYSLYAWIKVQQEDAKAALEALNLATTKSDHPALIANKERIANGKLKQFSNQQLGDAWYSLYLEEPKMKQQRQERRFV